MTGRCNVAIYLLLLAIVLTVAALGIWMDAAAFVGSLFGVIATIGAVLLFEAQLRPRLTISAESKPPDPAGLGGRVFLRLLIRNKSIAWPLNLFVDRRTALLTRAWITFLNEQNQALYRHDHRMRGRWAGTPEPQAVLLPGNPPVVYRDPSRTIDTVDIAPSDTSILDVVMRAPDSDSCFGWHNDIIERPNPPPDVQFTLDRGRFHALVTVRTGGRDTRPWTTQPNRSIQAVKSTAVYYQAQKARPFFGVQRASRQCLHWVYHRIS